MNGRLNPVDICDDSGVCQIRSADTELLPDIEALQRSKWWMITHRAPGAVGKSRAGSFTFGTHGTLTVQPFGNSEFGSDPSSPDGAWCLDRTGTMTFALGERITNGRLSEGLFVGSLARETEIIAGAGLTNDDLLIGTRLGGDPDDVDGPYSVLMTRKTADDQMLVYIGSMTFKSGVLEDTGLLTGEGDGRLEFNSGTTHFTATDADSGLGGAILDLTVDGETPRTQMMVGAIAPEGDAVVMMSGDRDLNGLEFEYGLMILVRSDNDTGAPPETTLPSWWNTTLHLPSSGIPGGSGYTALAAIVMARGTEIMGGIYGRDGANWALTETDGRIAGGTLQINASGKIGIDILLATARPRFGGYASRARDFGFLFDAGDADWDDPKDISDQPMSSTFGFIVKRYETPETLNVGN